MKLISKKNKKITNRFKYAFSFLEKHIIVKFLINTKFQYGPLYHVLIRPYLVATRRKHSLFNLNYLISQIRQMLYIIYIHSYFKELIIILATNQKSALGYRKFYLFSHWLPGFLTNFKQLMRRALAETRYYHRSNLSTILSGALKVKRNPQLPTLTISLSAHNHWFYTEGHRLGLTKFTNSETLHSKILQFNQQYLPVNIMLRLVRETLFMASLDDRFYFKHKKRVIKKVFKRIKKQKHKIQQKRLFNKNSK